MTTPDPTAKPHSAEYFGEQRDFWWNDDFVALMARRWRLGEVHMALDVGCGVGHWGRVLLPHLPADARLFGIDREAAWVEEAAARAERAGHGARTSYRLGDAERIPFHDGVFDLVTCQTVLIHVRDPRAVLREMMRVTKPGGLVAVAEPNNVSNAVTLGSTMFHEDPDRLLGLLRFQMICQRGKAALGLGHNSIGDMLPGYFAEVGFTEIQVHTSDKASALFPPYAGREQQAVRAQEIEWAERGFWIWDRDETQKYFVAGGGGEAAFDRQWDAAIAASREIAAGLRAGTEHRAGGGIQYLIAGRKAA